MQEETSGRVLAISKSTIANLIAACAAISKQELLKAPVAKQSLYDLSKNLSIIFQQLEAGDQDMVYCRIATSGQVMHDNYFELVKIPRTDKKTKSEALYEALNFVLTQSSSKADVKLVSESAGDTHFEFVISVNQSYY